MVIMGQEIPKGYWLVDAQWYKMVQTSHRAYVLLPEKIKLNVNAMVRLPEPIEFEEVKSRKKPAPAPAPSPAPSRASTRLQLQPPPPKPPQKPPPKPPQREKYELLSEPKHNEILVSLSDHRQ
mgnify:CR=1 FL=1